MYDIETADVYRRWIDELRDQGAKARIDIRVRRLANGNPGDVRFVGDGVMEIRIDYVRDIASITCESENL